MTKYKLEFRHRPNFSESIEDRHNNFLRAVSDLGVPWGLSDSLKVPPYWKRVGDLGVIR